MLQRLSFFGIWYSRDVYFSLIWYSYGDYAGSIDNRKGTCGNVFSLGSGASSKQQDVVTLSTSGAKYLVEC